MGRLGKGERFGDRFAGERCSDEVERLKSYGMVYENCYACTPRLDWLISKYSVCLYAVARLAHLQILVKMLGRIYAAAIFVYLYMSNI